MVGDPACTYASTHQPTLTHPSIYLPQLTRAHARAHTQPPDKTYDLRHMILYTIEYNIIYKTLSLRLNLLFDSLYWLLYYFILHYALIGGEGNNGLPSYSYNNPQFLAFPYFS